MNQLLHTPEGVRDIYGDECAVKLVLEDKIRRVFHSYGYNDIQTPTLEYFDVFSKERGSVASQEMFKLFDNDNNTLVLRPDMTPPIVRCVSKYYEDADMPVRLCYNGRTFINDRSYRLRLKEGTDAGAELFGDDTLAADVEIIACMIDCLKACGLQEFQIDIGSAAFLEGVFAEIGFTQEVREKIRSYMLSKNFFALENLLLKENLTDRQREIFKRLQVYSGNISQVMGMESLVRNENSKAAIRRLKSIYKRLGYYDMTRFVSFDIGMVTGYRYYTGIVFNAYTYGTGNAIVSGGRYDTLMSQFGYDAPAIGFKINVDGLMTALDRQHIQVETPVRESVLLMDKNQSENCLKLAAGLRSRGERIAVFQMDEGMTGDDYMEKARRAGYDKLYMVSPSGAAVTIYDVADGSRRTVEYSDMMGGES